MERTGLISLLELNRQDGTRKVLEVFLPVVHFRSGSSIKGSCAKAGDAARKTIKKLARRSEEIFVLGKRKFAKKCTEMF